MFQTDIQIRTEWGRDWKLVLTNLFGVLGDSQYIDMLLAKLEAIKSFDVVKYN